MLYKVLCWPARLFFAIFFRWQITGLENIPKTGALLVCNHLSFWDIPLLGAALPRPVHFMAKRELFKNPVFAYIISSLNAFPVNRGTPDRAALKYAIDLMKHGEIVAVFPEGTRSKTGELGQFQPGAALLATKADVPAIPAVLVGTNLMFGNGEFFPQLKVHVGEPIFPALKDSATGDRHSTETLSQAIFESIQSLSAKLK